MRETFAYLSIDPAPCRNLHKNKMVNASPTTRKKITVKKKQKPDSSSLLRKLCQNCFEKNNP